jgi:hypothetical protein
MSDVTVTFGAKDNGVESTIVKIKGSLNNLEKSTQQASGSFDGGFKKMAIAGGVAGLAIGAGMKVIGAATDAARAVVNRFGDALELGGRLNDLSSRTGETAGKLLILERAFDNTGVGADKVGTSINKLQKFITDASDGAGKQAESMAQLGISMQDLQGKTPTEQMQVFAQKLAGIQDPTKRAALAMTVFGKSGGQLLPLLNNFSGELNAAKGQLGSLPGIMDRSAAAFDTIGDNFEAIKNKSLEFAVGLAEKLTPALEKFTNMLVGVDAASWGAQIGQQIIKISDLLIGAFKTPMTVVDALGSALYAHIATMGNLYINSLINGSKFLKEFWSSDLPKILIGQLGSALIKGYADGLKFFVDNIGQVIINFKESFGRAIESIATFFSNTFNKIVNFFATDFKNAMENPVDFIRGKLGSALSAATKDGSFSFKDAYDSASGSVIDRISKGLGAVSDEYGQKLKDGTGRIDEEWKKITGNIEFSARDFFGAEGASQRVKDKLGELEKTGQNFRKQLTGATGGAKSDTTGIKGDLEDGAGAMTKAAAKVKEALTMSQQISEDINKARKDNNIDKGGELKKRVNDAIDKGDFRKADRLNERIRKNEAKQELRGVDENGRFKDRRSLRDIAKQGGLDTRGMTNDEITDKINSIRKARNEAVEKQKNDPARKRQEEMKPGNEGEDKPGKDQGSSTLTTISKAVDAIKSAVLSLEKKLPQPALGY